jgi:hypothetical protein
MFELCRLTNSLCRADRRDLLPYVGRPNSERSERSFASLYIA